MSDLMATRDGEIVIGPWLENLIRQYETGSRAPVRLRQPRRVPVIAVGLAICAALTPTLLHRDSDAYPSEPDKRRVLEICGQVDPTFLRFVVSERAACYERFRGLVAQTASHSGPISGSMHSPQPPPGIDAP